MEYTSSSMTLNAKKEEASEAGGKKKPKKRSKTPEPKSKLSIKDIRKEKEDKL